MSAKFDRFDGFVVGVRDRVESELGRERRMIVPDFEAVVAAAHERDPKAVSEAALREVREFAPILRFGEFGEASVDDLSDAQLDAWIRDTREFAEAEVAARRLASVPPLSLALSLPLSPARLPALSPARLLVPALALAAVVALGFAVPRLLDAFVADNYSEAESANQSEYLGPEPSPERGAQTRLLPAPPPNEPVLQRAVTHSEPRPETVRRVRQRAKPVPVPDAKRGEKDRVKALDAEAQARWAKGDLEGAEQRFREIIEIAGRGRHADLAYGDLFTLARQRRDHSSQRTLWQEYLEQFPRGRFADDARAGLCRRAPDDQRVGCWQAYLQDFPSGVHRRAADEAFKLEEHP